jgi:hypothetical protein
LSLESTVKTNLTDRGVYRKGGHRMTTPVYDQAALRRAPDSAVTSKNNGSTRLSWDTNYDLIVAFLLHLLGIVAVVVLFVVAAGLHDGSAKDLLATALTAVTTLAAFGGGHAAGRAKHAAGRAKQRSSNG